jgi:hypothetical protein
MLRSGIVSEFFGIEDKEPLSRDEALAMLRSGECRVMLRVESRTEAPGQRFGAYNNGAVDRCIHDVFGTGDADLRDTHPTPHNDAGLAGPWGDLSRDEATKYLFGFDKFGQYKNWFFVEDRLKDEEEYSVIGVYIVSKEFSHAGQFQMIAHRDEMIHLCDLALTYKLDATLQELYDAQENSNAGHKRNCGQSAAHCVPARQDVLPGRT